MTPKHELATKAGLNQTVSLAPNVGPNLVRNVGLKGKKKLADKWERDVYLVVDQPNKGIPVFVVKREHGRSTRKLLHRNLLLPFMALPASKPNPLDTSLQIDGSQLLPAGTPESIRNTDQEDLTGTSSGGSNPASTTGAVNKPAMASDESVTSQGGISLNPDAIPFSPSPGDIAQPRVLPARNRRRPPWQTSEQWIM